MPGRSHGARRGGIPHEDLTGQKFGHLTAQTFLGLTPGRNALWRCLCDCGRSCVERAGKLKTRKYCAADCPVRLAAMRKEK